MRERRDDDGQAALSYMHVMLGQLRAMAERDRHDMLAYLIGMAHQEAADRVRNARDSRFPRNKRD